jgi:iron-sulfur cluster assembly accessory protein
LITDVGEALSALPEGQRPDKVIFLIMTDGMENRSQQWTWGAVKALITQQREVYNWEFIFLGADIDAVEVGARMGMDRGNAMTFDKPADDDEIVEQHGVKVIIDRFSVPYLLGAEFDYEEGFQGAGFRINNPNSTGSCGCGKSFTA